MQHFDEAVVQANKLGLFRGASCADWTYLFTFTNNNYQQLRFKNMMEHLLYIGCAQALFSALLLMVKHPKPLANRVLSFWFFIIFIHFAVMLWVLESGNLLMNVRFARNHVLLMGPCFYLYAYVLINGAFKKNWLKHLWPFVLFFMLDVVMVALGKPLVIEKGQIFPPNAMRVVFGLFSVGVVIFYTFKAKKLINLFESEMEDSFSNQDNKLRLQWLKFLLFLFFSIYALGIGTGALNAAMEQRILLPAFFVQAGFVVLVFAFSYFSFNQPTLFTQPILPSEQWDDAKAVKPKYNKSGLKEPDVDRIATKIKQHVEDGKAYMHADFNIMRLCESIGESRHHVTEVLNNEMGSNFYGYINGYRVEAAKSMLVDKQYAHLTILGIGYDCGFNSKSSFNSVFKKMTGMTPSFYKTSAQ